MMFFNAILLGGIAALAIPLVIHLLNRSRYRVIPWGAMHLIDDLVQVNSRRLEWKSLLLLLLRCAIPVVLALCMARPLLTAWKTAGGDGQAAVVMLVDNSLSMDAPAMGDGMTASSPSSDAGSVPPGAEAARRPSSAVDRSALEAAKQQAATILQQMDRSTQWSVISIGGSPMNLTEGSTRDDGEALRQLRSIRGGHGSSDTLAAVRAALEQLDRSTQTQQHILLLSDFQQSQVDPLSDPLRAVIKDELQRRATKPLLTLLPIARRDGTNRSIHLESDAVPVTGIDQPFEVRVAVDNHDDQPVSGLIVSLEADGVVLTSKSIDIGSRSTSQQTFFCRFPTPGTHVVSARLIESDAVAGDNQSFMAVRVPPTLDVLLVDSQPQAPGLDGETAFLQIAVSPQTIGQTRGTDLMRSQRIDPDQISDALLAESDVVVLANIARLRDDVAQRLEQFVRGGGGLVVFAGDQLDVNWYHQRWVDDPARRFLPMRWGPRSTPASRGTPSVAVDRQVYAHPALQGFNRSANGKLESIELNEWLTLQGVEGESSQAGAGKDLSALEQAQATTSAGEGNGGTNPPLWMAKLTDGSIWFAERRVGEGVVVQCSSAVDDDWSNLPRRPVFVPLMQELMRYGALTSVPPMNVSTGDPILMLPDLSDPPTRELTPQSGDSQRPVAIELPDGTNQWMQPPMDDPSDRPDASQAAASADSNNSLQRILASKRQRLDPSTLWTFAAARQSGVYRVTGLNESPQFAVARAERNESVLKTIDRNGLDQLADQLGASVAGSADEFLRVAAEREHGKEIWRWLWALLIVLLFAEILLQQWLRRLRRQGVTA
jgi:hypothetical protein